MKKFKIITVATISVCLMLSIVFSCCTISVKESKKEEPVKDGSYEYNGGMWNSSIQYKIEELTIDSCQYIIIFGQEGRNIIHKANCRNAVHTYRQL